MPPQANGRLHPPSSSNVPSTRSKSDEQHASVNQAFVKGNSQYLQEEEEADPVKLANGSPKISLDNGKHRATGSFLLHNSATSSAAKHGSGSPVYRDKKGKEKVSDAIRLPKRDRQSKMIEYGSTPNSSKRNSHISSLGESSRSAVSFSPDNSRSSLPRTSESSVGLGIDSTQIVNLALNLGEARRRNASSGTHYSSGKNSVENGRRISVAPKSSPINVGGSLRRPFQDVGRTLSSNSEHKRVNDETRRISRRSPDLRAGSSPLRLSEATAARVERAKRTLEGGYEFRRLLQYLEAHPKPGHPYDGSLDREFNPLQYVRNRRVRLREKKPLNAELDGWSDVERARAWVDAVRQREDRSIDDDRRISLPAFGGDTSQANAVESTESPVDHVHRDAHGRYLRRPKMDWVFAPWEMFADVVWEHQDQNFKRLEDAQGKLLYGNHTHHQPKRSRDESLSHPFSALSRIAMHGVNDIHRHHRNTSSIDSDDSALKMHRNRWPRNFRRSRSSSSDASERRRFDEIRADGGYPALDELPEQDKDVDSDEIPMKPVAKPRPRLLHHQTEKPRPHQYITPPASPPNGRTVHRRMSSDDLLSPSGGRPHGSSPTSNPTTSPLRPLVARLGSFRRGRSSSNVGGKDGRSEVPTVNERSKQILPDVSSVNELSKTLSHQTSDSKGRGRFRSGRIAELVGGERMRRKHGSSSHLASPSSTNISDMTDSDIDLSQIHRTDTDDSTEEDDAGLSKPTYHLSNLPTFQSRSMQKSSSQDDHHITRQQRAANQDRGRSSNPNRLALPRIDVTGSPSWDRSRSRSQTRSRSQSVEMASRSNHNLNEVIGIPGQPGVGKDRMAVTGLANLSSVPQPEGESSHENGKKASQPWSLANCVSTVNGRGITQKDIARVRAFLLSSGVKAHEITRRNQEPPSSSSSPFLSEFTDLIPKQPLTETQTPPSQEHVLVARSLISALETSNTSLRSTAESFSNTEAEALHARMGQLDDRVNTSSTARVRKAADEADLLSVQLRTTHLLATKDLNDSIDGLLRRRRRGARWLRSGGWMVLEWVVLGILWIMWAVAVIVRLVARTGQLMVAGVRWLMWV